MADRAVPARLLQVMGLGGSMRFADFEPHEGIK